MKSFIGLLLGLLVAFSWAQSFLVRALGNEGRLNLRPSELKKVSTDPGANKPDLTSSYPSDKSVSTDANANQMITSSNTAYDGIIFYSFEDVKKRIELNKPSIFQLIDVREPVELLQHPGVRQGYIPTARNVPFSKFNVFLNSNEEQFQNTFGFNKPDKKKEIIFYCKSGHRSRQAAELARANGYQRVCNYFGSWLDWEAHTK